MYVLEVHTLGPGHGSSPGALGETRQWSIVARLVAHEVKTGVGSFDKLKAVMEVEAGVGEVRPTPTDSDDPVGRQ